MSKRPEAFDQMFSLNGAGIDRCSESIEKKLKEMGIERENRLRIRLSLEESLLRMRDHFGEREEFRLRINQSLSRNIIQIEMEGDIFNPLSKTQAEMEDWSGSLLTAVGLSPTYSYSRGKNTLRLTMGVKGINAAYKILIAVLLGLAAGFGLRYCLPVTVQEVVTEKMLTPFYDLWVRVLSVLSGPVIFLMVLSSVLNAGTIEEEGGSSTRVVMRYFIFSLFAALIAAVVAGLLSSQPLIQGETMGIKPADYFDALLKTMPSDVFTPLIQSNTPQILILAFILGNGIVILGERASQLNTMARQANSIGLMMTEAVSRCVPFFSAVLLCLEIMQKNMLTFKGMWLMLPVSLLTATVTILCVVCYVAGKKKVKISTLIKKCWPAFVTAIKTGGIDEGYGRMERSCVRELGMERHFTTVSLPFGLVLYMPVNVIGTLIFTIYAGIKYNAQISLGWLIIAMVLAVFLFVATPPVPGANLLAYIMIFNQLGIPPTALIDAMIFDILFGIFATAGNQMLLQMDLILQADKIGLLNKEILRS